MTRSFTVYLTLCFFGGEWRRVGNVYVSKKVAKSWLSFVMKTVFATSGKVEPVAIKVLNGKPTQDSVNAMRKWGVDLT